MPDYFNTPSSNSTGFSFGRNFFKSIVGKLPYSNYNPVENINQLNPNFAHFYDISKRRDEIIDRLSVSIAKNTIRGQEANQLSIASGMNFVVDKGFHEFMYASLDPNKVKRLSEYRMMAAYSKLSNAIDEICDECIVQDDKGRIVTMQINSEDRDPEEKKELQKEWDKFIQHFEFDDKGKDYFRFFLVDGELFFENIISEEHPRAGVLAVKLIPSELTNPIYENILNNIVKGYIVERKVYDLETKKEIDQEFIPFDKNQITYIQSGMWDETRQFKLPFIERARRAYKQLAMIEDSIILYRMVRSPERLVFNVPTGNMPPYEAEAYLKRLQQAYFSKKTYDPSQGRGINTYDPQSMLDSYWFAQPEGVGAVNMKNETSSLSMGDLPDLHYFHAELLRALKVPSSRIDPTAGYADGAEITREELRFARFIIELQKQFASGLKTSFIVHLKMKGYWDAYDLFENEIYIKFNEPTNFNELRKQQIFELRANNFDSMSNNDSVSKLYAQKKYLGWSDEEILANIRWMKKEAAIVWEIEQIRGSGPNWKDGISQEGNAGGEGIGFEGGGGAVNSGLGDGSPGGEMDDMGGSEGGIGDSGGMDDIGGGASESPDIEKGSDSELP